jgi:hypothetical protein
VLEILSETNNYELTYFLLKYVVESELVNLDTLKLKQLASEDFFVSLAENFDSIENALAKKICENYLKFKGYLNFRV